MTTLQEQFEKDFPDKSVREIVIGWEYEDNDFTNRDLDLSEYVNLEKLVLRSNGLTSANFLKTILNPEKLELLSIFDNKIQPTDISIFSKFVNLRELRIGTMKMSLEQGRHNKFYGSLKSYQNLTKLEKICIEATDVDSGLECLPESLAKATKEKKYENIECSPHGTNAKCRAIQDQLRPFNYDLEAWQLAHPEKMALIWKERYQNKSQLVQDLETKITETKQELERVKTEESEKTAKIERLKTSIQLLEETKIRLENELAREQQQHNQTKNTFANQLKELATIIFPSSANISHLSFSDLKEQTQKVKNKNQELKLALSEEQKASINKQEEINWLKEQLRQSLGSEYENKIEVNYPQKFKQ